MKKFIISIFAVALIAGLFVSCEKKESANTNSAKSSSASSKKIKDPVEYYKGIVQREVKDTINGLEANYISIEDFSSALEITAEITDAGKKLISDIDDEFDLDWLKKLSVTTNLSTKDSKYLLNLAGIINNGKISADLYLDNNQMIAYVPLLNKKYVGVKTDTVEDTTNIEIMELFDEYMEMMKTYTDIKLFSETISNYENIILKYVTDVKYVGTESIEVDGLSQSCNLLKVTVKGEELKDCVAEVSKTARRDRGLKELLNLASEMYNEIENTSYYYRKDFYRDFIEALEDLNDDLEDVDDDTGFVMDVYVDNKDIICGRVLYLFDEYYGLEEIGHMFKTESKGKYKLEIASEEMGKIKSSGTVKGTVYSGDVTLYDDYDDEIYSFTVDSYDSSLPKKGQLALKVSFNNLDDFDVPSGIGLSVDISIAPKKSSVKYSITQEKTPLASVLLSSKVGSASTIKTPSDVVFLQDEDDLEDFVSNIDFTGLKRFVSSLGMPDEYEDLIQDGIEELEDSVDYYF